VNAFFWTAVESVRAERDEVVVRLHHPFAGLPSLLRSWHSAIHNQQARERHGDGWGRTVADGTGPFVFERLVPGRVQEVRRHDGFCGPAGGWFENSGPAYLDAVQWVPILDEAERAIALEEGRVDCVQNPSLLDVARLEAHPDLRVISYQQSSLAYLALDHQTERLGFHDLRVRQAISHAIDRRSLVDRELAGLGWPAQGPIPSASSWYTAEVERFNTYDPARAETLLDEAGLPRDETGTRLRFRALLLEDATLRRAARAIVEMLAAVGIALDLDEIAGFADFYAALGSHPEAFISKWFWPDPVDATVGFVSSWSHAGPNWQRASLPDVDAACRAWQEAPHDDALRAAAHRLQMLSGEQLPLVPLFSPAAVWAHHRRVHGWRPTPTNLYPFYGDVWLEPR
jgi:peptide/nickel transport system substrate-binding protein